MSKDMDKELSGSAEKVLTKEELKAKKENEKNSRKAAAAKLPKKSIKKYLKDTKAEFKKVVWPTRKSVVTKTTVVLVALLICSIAIWALDSVFGWSLRILLDMN